MGWERRCSEDAAEPVAGGYRGEADNQGEDEVEPDKVCVAGVDEAV